MTSYSVQPRDRVFVKGYGFLSFVRNFGKKICKDVIYAFKTVPKRVIQKQQKQLVI